MPIDTSIYGAIQQPKSVNLLAQYADMMQLQGAQQANQLNRLKMDEYTRGVERQNRLTGMLQGGADAASLRQGGFLKEANDWDEQAAKIEKERAQGKKYGADAEKAQLETAMSKVRFGAQLLSTAKDQPTYDAARQEAIAYGLDVSRMPTQFDPAFVQRKFQESQTVAEQLDQIWKQRGYDLDVRKQSETERNNRTQNSISAGNLAVSRERLAFDKQSPRGVLDPERGLLVDPRTGEARPVTMGGQPVGMKVAPEARKELLSINQQRAAINGAIVAAEKAPSAFGFWRGLAGGLPGGESIAGRMETMDETQARAYVFNNVSRIINERAGTAQSAQELARLNQFLPSATDGKTQIVNKLKGFNTYLDDMERGTRTPTSPGAAPANTGAASGSFAAPADDPLGLRR